MSPENRNQEWLEEFEIFMKQDAAVPPHSVSSTVLSKVITDLNPSLKLVSAKLFFLHTLGAGIVTLFCPQLGVGPIMGGHGIMYLFMHFGPVVCAAICGAIFLGMSAGLATIFLEREELRLANKYRFLNVTLLASLSFSGLMLAGGSADRLTYAFWILGAIAAGWMILKLGAFVRLRPATYQLRLG